MPLAVEDEAIIESQIPLGVGEASFVTTFDKSSSLFNDVSIHAARSINWKVCCD